MQNNYIVSARKYRPQTFESVVGQRPITRTLKNAILTKQLAHAYLFCGPRGVGKTTCARIFAKTINCQNIRENGEACNECDSCKSFNTGRSMNIHELDAASNNSVDDIRSLIEKVRIPPQLGKYSVYIIDEVHMLSQAAFNAFLKTLEEPPKHAIFILATTEKHKILPTILSRCQIYDFQRIKVNDITEHLAYIAKTEGIEAEPKALSIIAQKADGGLRDALSIFDQIVSFSFGKVTYEQVLDSLNVLDYDYYFKFTDLIIDNKYDDILILFDTVLQKGFETQTIIAGLASHFRDLLVCQHEKTVELLQYSEDIKQAYTQQAKKSKPVFLIRALDLIARAETEHRTALNKRLHAEIILLQLCLLAENIYHPTVQQKEEPKNIPLQEQQQTPITQNNQKSENQLLSISNLLKNVNIPKVDNQKPQEQQNKKQIKIENLTWDDIKPHWIEYAEKIKNEQPRIYTIMTDNQIKLEGQTIVVALVSDVQKEKFTSQMHDIQRFIKERLSIEINFRLEVTPQASTKKIIYTDEQKYEYLKSKNPKLDDLKDNFKLNF